MELKYKLPSVAKFPQNIFIIKTYLLPGPATEIMSTSFTQDSPTEPTSPERADKRDTAAELLKEWDSDSDSHTSNSSSGEFIWKVSVCGVSLVGCDLIQTSLIGILGNQIVLSYSDVQTVLLFILCKSEFTQTFCNLDRLCFVYYLIM